MRWIFLVCIIISGLLISCDENGNSNSKNDFYVKFQNLPSSHFAISRIELQAMGRPDQLPKTPKSDWGQNILINSKQIAVGDSAFFYLNIPSGEWSNCRIGVIDSSGKEVLLHTQENYEPMWDNPITHWGADTRSVSVSIVRDKSTGLIIINSWGDWAGLDN
jgi:hypothetical protein